MAQDSRTPASIFFDNVAPGEFNAYRDDDLVATITTRQDGVRLFWGGDQRIGVRFANISEAMAAVERSQ